MKLFGLVSIFSGNLKLLEVAVLILEAIVLHGKYVHDTVETKTGIDRELDDGYLLLESFLKGVTGVLPVGLFGVKLVHSHDHRLIVLVSIAGENLRSNLNSLLGIDGEDSGLADFECGNRTTAEVVGTRSVDDVELGVHELG